MSTSLQTEPIGWQIRCAICGPSEERDAQPLLMSRGITVWLCADHMATDYRLHCGGATFVDALTSAWESSSGLTIRRQEALAAHLRWVRQVMDALRPPTFITPWLGPARQSGGKRRKKQQTGGRRLPKPNFLKPVKPPAPAAPGDDAPPPPPPGIPASAPKPRNPSSGPRREDPDERPP